MWTCLHHTNYNPKRYTTLGRPLATVASQRPRLETQMLPEVSDHSKSSKLQNKGLAAPRSS